MFAELRQRLEQRHGPSAGVRQYIRVLQLLAEHPLLRVQQAIERGRHVEDLHADRIIQHVHRLAEQHAKRTETRDPAQTCEPSGLPDLDDALSGVQVPLVGLNHFDQFLTTGEPTYA